MKRPDLTRMLVVDTEGTCWNDIPREEQWQKTEIIEFGITEIDLINKLIVKTKSYLVRPIHTQVNEYCTSLTTITPEMVATAPDLMKVSKMIRQDFNPTNVVWGAWGSDNDLIIRECVKKGAVMPFSDRYLDLQQLYSMINGLEKTVSMTKLLASLNIPLEGTLHRADADSLNTAKIVLQMFQKTPMIVSTASNEE